MMSNFLVRIESLKNQAVIADKCIVAESFVDRFMGLMGKTAFSSGQGMLFPRCNSVHVWFMRISIDVVFLRLESKQKGIWKVLAVHSGVKPWKLIPLWNLRATEVLELPVGTIQRSQIQPGDDLCIS